MSASAAALSVRDLRVVYPGKKASLVALDVGSIDVEPGAFVAVTGPSGSGKSTLLYALAGLVRPASGRIVWGENDIGLLAEGARDQWRRRTIGFVFQDFHLLPELGPLANVLLPVSFERFGRPEKLRTRAAELLNRFSVPSNRASVADLSRGEQQRVALARSLLFDPPVLLADEPTASLDTEAGQLVAKTLEELSVVEGRTVIAVTHDPMLIERIGRRVELDRGHRRATEKVN